MVDSYVYACLYYTWVYLFYSFSSPSYPSLRLANPTGLDVGNVALGDRAGRLGGGVGSVGSHQLVAKSRVLGTKGNVGGEGTVRGPLETASGALTVKRLAESDVGDGRDGIVNGARVGLSQAERSESEVTDRRVRDANDIGSGEDALVADIRGRKVLGVLSNGAVLVRLVQVVEEGQGQVGADLGGNFGEERGGAEGGTVGNVVRGRSELDRLESRVGSRVGRRGRVVVRGPQAHDFPSEGVLSDGGFDVRRGNVVLGEVFTATSGDVVGECRQGLVGATTGALDGEQLVKGLDQRRVRSRELRHDDRDGGGQVEALDNGRRDQAKDGRLTLRCEAKHQYDDCEDPEE